ncbi:MAG: glycosyltransferase family 2 protein, partial [Acidobacteria bacterium]|nr:glycosyltransferase family 2 protein [Acidobacteriota bacterium]
MRLSFVLPAFSEAENLEALIPRLLSQKALADELEVVVVDDHSPDATFEVVRAWAARDAAVRGVRLAKNAGSHMAILCGLTACTGDVAIVLAADGQDPPEMAPKLVDAWRNGAHVVWAVRDRRIGESALTVACSRAYYATMNRLTTVRLPSTGADFFLLDRRVIDVVKRMPERNTSIFALVSWMGFRQTEIRYDKQERGAGRSTWTLARRVRLAFDSLFGFSVLPLKIASGLGFLYALAGFCYAAVLVANKVTGGRLFGGMAAEGWSALMVVLLISSGTVMLVLGLFGEYLWRTLEEVRGRPRFIVEEEVNAPRLG